MFMKNCKALQIFYFLFFLTSCTVSLPSQFPDSRKSKEQQIFSVEDIQKAECQIVTKKAQTENSLKSRAQKFTIEPNQFDSVVFQSNKSIPSVINNFPFVDYEIRGSSICQALLYQKQVRLMARPFSVYSVRFQIIGSYIRILLEGRPYHLPYQNLASSVYSVQRQYAVPIGGYEITQGKVREVKNVENRETHLLDFFPNSNQPFERVITEGRVVHWIRKGAESIWIPRLNEGFQRYVYQEKKDVLPKNYFDGVWYSGVSIVIGEPLSALNGFQFSGNVVSGDSYSGMTAGQKVYFQFEADQLRAINENYRQQSRQLKLNLPAEAEALSFPIQHRDYRSASKGSLIGGSLEEEANKDLSWENTRYVEIDFTRINHYFGKRVQAVLSRYGNALKGFSKTNFVTVREVRFAHNYFDVVVYDGNLEYRFSFLRKPAESSYEPRALSVENKRFEYFYVPDKRAFYDPIESFKEDYENNILLTRIQPDRNNQITLHFSNLTSKDEKIRSIGRSAVSLWNQALQKAGLSLSLVLDESKDVSVGDIRYHVLNIVSDPHRPAGLGQRYVDDDTGQVVASSSNVYLNSILSVLKASIINYSYRQQRLSQSDSLFVTADPSLNLPFSKSSLDYFSFQNKKHFIRSLPSFDTPQSPSDIDQYRRSFQQVKQQILSSPSDLFTQLTPALSSDEFFIDWMKQFKAVYALNTGVFPEDESFSQVQEKRWTLEKWEDSRRGVGGEHLFQIVSRFCSFISHPVRKREQFKKDVDLCAERIYPMYALGSVVHEMGHSLFSLFHNFAGSKDRQNFYPQGEYHLGDLAPYISFKDSQGVKRGLHEFFPPVSSSVMDYISLDHGEQWTPGPYDVAAVRHLYSDFTIPQSSDVFAENQFAQCSDWSAGAYPQCLRFDIESLPEESVLAEIRTLFKRLDYGLNNIHRTSRFNLDYGIYLSVDRLMTFYYEWRKRLNHFISQKKLPYISQMTREDYDRLIKEIVEKGKTAQANSEEKELLGYYRVRNLIYHALSYISFLPNRYCVLKRTVPENGSAHPQKDIRVLLELSKVIQFYRSNNAQLDEDILSCWSNLDSSTVHTKVQKYINIHYPHFEVEREIGHFLHPYSVSKNLTYQGLSPSYYNQYQGSFGSRETAFSALTMTEILFPHGEALRRFGEFPVTMMNERDIESGVERLILARVTRGVFFSHEKDFFQSLEGVLLEELTPEKSAYLLFDFPETYGGKDVIFRDELIQNDKLVKNAIQPYRRDDQHNVSFFQNFEAEKELVRMMSLSYLVGQTIAGGHYLEEINAREDPFLQSVQAASSLSGQLLVDKAFRYLDHQNNPDGAVSYYFDFKNFYITPIDSQSALGGIGNIIISELAKNSLRILWTTPYLDTFFAKPRKNGEDTWSEVGFTRMLIFYLNNVVQFQNSRLGRFYFMYFYMIAIGLLEVYDHVLTHFHHLDIEEIHQQARDQVKPFIQHIQRLFYIENCNLFSILNQTYNRPLPEEAPPFSNGEERHKAIMNTKRAISTVCPENIYSKRGKLQVLYSNQSHIINYRNSVLHRDFSFLPHLNRLGFGSYTNQIQEFIANQNESIQTEAMLGHFNGIADVHLPLFRLFEDLFPFSEDVDQVQSLLRAHRQLLVDTFPKLMLMYSGDRYFVGEMMWIIGEMYNACMYRRGSSHLCPLTIEKLMSYYFSGVLYGSNLELERSFVDHLRGKKPFVDGGMSLEDLTQFNPNDIIDRFIISPFSFEVLLNYIFFERKWSYAGAHLNENRVQRDLLLTLFPLVRSRIREAVLINKPLDR